MLSWPGCQHAITVVLPSLLYGEPLHQRLDALIAEHSPSPITSITVYRHLSTGRWLREQLHSRRYGLPAA